MASERGSGKRGNIFAFSSDQSLLATCSSDSRVKVWDAKTSTLVLDCTALAEGGGHTNEALLGPFNCLVWVGHRTPNPQATPKSAQKKGKKKGPSADQVKHFLVAGTPSGAVVAWDPAGGQLAWSATPLGLEEGVSALAAGDWSSAAGGAALWAGAQSGTVCQLSIESGQVLSSFSTGKAAVSSLALSPSCERLLVGGTSLKLFDVATQRRAWKASGHTAPVTQCAFTPDGEHALSCARGERHVALWDLSAAKPPQTAAGTLSLAHPIVSFSCSTSNAAASPHPSNSKSPLPNGPANGDAHGDSSPAPLRVLAVTSEGTAYLWSAEEAPELLGSKPVAFVPKGAKAPGSAKKKKGAAAAAAGAGRNSGVLAGALASTAQDSLGSVLLVRGSVARPRVERVSDGEGHTGGEPLGDGEERVVLLAPMERGDLLPANGEVPGGARTGVQGAGGVEVASALPAVGNGELSMEEASRIAQGSGAALASDGRKKKRKAAEEGKSEKGEGKGEGVEGEEEGQDGAEETLEEKLRSLGIAPERPKEGGEGASGQGLVPASGNKGAKEMTPRGDSLLVLLQQAVAAEDDRLLESCLGVEDESVIANTVRRLSPQTAVKFLSVAVSRIQSRPQRARALAPWLRALLLNHAALLMSSPGAQPLLMSLYQEVDSRVQLFQPMLALSGRLDLVVSSIRQIQRQKGKKGASGKGVDSGAEGGDGDEEIELQGVAVYDEGMEGSDVEVEDATRERGEEEGEEEWEEDGVGTGTEGEGEEEEGEEGEEGEDGEMEEGEDEEEGDEEDAMDEDEEEEEEGDEEDDDEDDEDE